MRALQHFVLFAVVAYGFAIGSGGDFRRSLGPPTSCTGSSTERSMCGPITATGVIMQAAIIATAPMESARPSPPRSSPDRSISTHSGVPFLVAEAAAGAAAGALL